MPPQKMSSLPHEDWVSSVSCQLPGYVNIRYYYNLVQRVRIVLGMRRLWSTKEVSL